MARREVISLQATGAAPLRIDADALAVTVHEEDVGRASSAVVRALDDRLGGALAGAIRAERFEGKAGQELRLATLGRIPAATLVLAGVGPRGDGEVLARAGNEPLRSAAGRAARTVTKAGARSLAVTVPEGTRDVAQAARAAAEGALLGAYEFRRYKTGKKSPPGLDSLRVAVPAGRERARELGEELALAGEIARSVAWARDLVNLGPADCTPTHLADAARELAREAGLRVEIRGPREIAALEMGMFRGVTRGSAEPPRLVTVSHLPKGAGARRPPVVLVGKAITFDSGGLSLKPTESMVTMNTDMAGAPPCSARCG